MARTVIQKLISNAIKYSHHDSEIDIEYMQDKDFAITKVHDFGIDIASEKL